MASTSASAAAQGEVAAGKGGEGEGGTFLGFFGRGRVAKGDSEVSVEAVMRSTPAGWRLEVGGSGSTEAKPQINQLHTFAP